VCTPGALQVLSAAPPSEDAEARAEVRTIAGVLARARREVATLWPHHLRSDAVPSADAELDAIVRDTEAATHVIMGAAEMMLASDAPTFAAYRTEVQAHALTIFEACSFQDITGQRVAKVVAALHEVETRVDRLSAALGLAEEALDLPAGPSLLNGPALGGPETTQAAIDALFAADPEPLPHPRF
jgi:hypothetical protein